MSEEPVPAGEPMLATPVAAAALSDAELLAVTCERVRRRLPRITRDVVRTIQTTEPAYGDPASAPTNLEPMVRTMILDGLRTLSEPEHEDASALNARSMGQRRAEEHHPLDALMRAYRIGAEALWNALMAEAVVHDPGGVRTASFLAARFWKMVGRDLQILAESYRTTREDLDVRPEQRRRAQLEELLSGSDPDRAPAVAAALGLPSSGRFVVAAVRSPGGRAVPAPPPDGVVALGLPQSFGRLVVAWLGPVSERTIGSWLGSPEVRVGIGPVVDAVGELHRSRYLAEVALRSTAGGEVAHFGQVLPQALALEAPLVGGEIADLVLGPLDSLPDDERELLLDTFRAWVELGGQARAVGEHLDVHRNTVQNRLRRLGELTGRDLARPADLVDLVLAEAAEKAR
ncbi:PucR family transcriptional regulator [Nocardioides sp. GXZ039]|uniref:PucR family transcriptional regulator n=1 Tax=Nocardioides sp. GXZ039 TaxID=3136018 RepID=UPI0030F45DB6